MHIVGGTLSEVAARTWAKSEPVYPLWSHLLDVAAVATELLDVFPPPQGFPARVLCALIGLHDIGKADPLFQLKDERLCVEQPPELFAGMDVRRSDVAVFRHEARSREVLEALLSP